MGETLDVGLEQIFGLSALLFLLYFFSQFFFKICNFSILIVYSKLAHAKSNLNTSAGGGGHILEELEWKGLE